jgi:hypothetical protein
MITLLGTQLPSTSKCEIQQKNTETNVEYFSSAIVSSTSRSFVKEEMQSKQEPNSKLNPSPAVSNKDESDTKSPSSQRKKKKKAYGVEETHTNNVASSECVTWNSSQGPVELENAVEPIRKKKKLKNKNGASSEFVTSNSSEAHHELEEIVEPIRKKKELQSQNGKTSRNPQNKFSFYFSRSTMYR